MTGTLPHPSRPIRPLARHIQDERGGPSRSCLHPLRPPSSSDGPRPPLTCRTPGLPSVTPRVLGEARRGRRDRPEDVPRGAPPSPRRLPSRGRPPAVGVGSPAAVGRQQSAWAPWGMRGWLWFVCLFLCLVIKTFIWPSKRNLICSVSKLLILTPRRRATGHGAGTRSPLTDVSREAVVAGGRAARLPRGGREGLPRVTQPCQTGRAPPSPRS